MTRLHTSMQPQVADLAALNLAYCWYSLQIYDTSHKSVFTQTVELQVVASTGMKGQWFCACQALVVASEHSCITQVCSMVCVNAA